jgi:hypothetical protein
MTKNLSIFEEVDFATNEVLVLQMDVFSLTIGANITKNVSPAQLNFSIKQCCIVFLI